MTLRAAYEQPRVSPDLPRMPVVQIVAPGSGGVRDHAEQLQRAWRQQGRSCSILAVRDTDLRRHTLDAIVSESLSLSQPDPQGLGAARGETAVLLHFSGYGYEQRGLCWRLAKAVQARSAPGSRSWPMATFFHELFAVGAPWKSAFWLSPVQAEIARRVARHSDVVLTNTRHHASWLEGARRPGEPVEVWPVFATVGEPAVPAGAALRLGLGPPRAPHALLFGSGSTRARVAQVLRRRSGVAGSLKALGVESILEIGSGESQLGAGLDGLPSHFLGRLEQPRLHELLSQARFGLLEYPDKLLGKSSVFAAYAAHGVAAVNLAMSAGPADEAGDGAVAGRQFIALPTGRPAQPQALTEIARVATRARRWYDGHSLARQAAVFGQIFDAMSGRVCGRSALVSMPTARTAAER